MQSPSVGAPSATDLHTLKTQLVAWAAELGFAECRVSDGTLGEHAARLDDWLAAGHHGDMTWMDEHATLRKDVAALVPETRRVISVRMDYLPGNAAPMQPCLDDPERAYVSRYALGRDYHKLMRKRLATLGKRLRDQAGALGFRALVDSAPVMEKALAMRAGLGWIGKHSNLINARAGSWFFLGELFTDLALPVDAPQVPSHCGSCTRCIAACPTGAIVAPYTVDARRCISYLTIELKGAIPLEYREAIGNRIYGCDDCQLVCPWNKFATGPTDPAFAPRNGLDTARLVDLFAWDEATFLERLAGSPIRRIGHRRWLRNIAVALGNAPSTPEVIAALQARANTSDVLVSEHVHWALAQHGVGA
ncbi:MAG: tRNA epoxyqueuosine(34) reductase QueG [Pseudomonadota bacterium]